MSELNHVQPCCGCACHSAPNSTHPASQSTPVNTANDVSAVMAEVVRLQTQAILTLLQRDNPVTKPVVSQPSPTQPSGAVQPPPVYVISERIGSITLADWEGMSDARSRKLDLALKKIVDTALIPSISWKNVGLAIQRELAAVGFVFNTVTECTQFNYGGGWKDAENTALPDLVRMRAAAGDARKAAGSNVWVNEMVRVAVRLMELRGM